MKRLALLLLGTIAAILCGSAQAAFLDQLNLVPSATGGALMFTNNALPTTPAVQTVKTTGGNVFMLICTNTTAAIAYPHFFDVVSGSITLGTTSATYNLPPIPANTSGAGYVFSVPSWQFNNAINFIVSAGAAATDHATISAGVSCAVSYF